LKTKEEQKRNGSKTSGRARLGERGERKERGRKRKGKVYQWDKCVCLAPPSPQL
jgi:hypothetical protein